MISVYITNVAKYLPNSPVYNDEIEEFLGKIGGHKSNSKALVLRHNGIKCRYYAINKNGESTHTNAELAAEAIRGLNDDFSNINDAELLACGTSTPDQLLPSHASMVHGLVKINPIDVMSASGSCNSSMWALNYAWMSLALGKVKKAICTGSELCSRSLVSINYEEEVNHLKSLGINPYIAFEKDFLRWMLSDGAAALFLQDKPAESRLSLRIDWIEIKSYANEFEACMYYGAVKDSSGNLIPWRDIEPHDWITKSVFAVKQDSALLEKHITQTGGRFLNELKAKKLFDPSKVTYFLPHLSSEFFRKKIKEAMLEFNLSIPEDKWFTNLEKVGNIGSASGFVMLEELFSSNRLKVGDTILIMIPESARFSYSFSHLTVV